MRFHTSSAEETLELGEKIGKLMVPGDIILLFGDLGAGKTTLTQGIATGLDVGDGEYVRSPTFTLINEYGGRLPVYHIDLYRIESQEEMEQLGLEEFFFGRGVAIVEWADKLFPEKNGRKLNEFNLNERIEVFLKIIKNDTRSIEIKTFNLSQKREEDFTLQ